MIGFNDRVYNLIKKIPKGRVSTYRIVAERLGTRAYRAVGQALRRNSYAPFVPCHRVVCSDGKLGGYSGKMNSSKKIRLLKKEGLLVKNNKIIDFERKLYRF